MAKKGKSTLHDLSAFLKSETEGKADYLEKAAHTLVEVERVATEGTSPTAPEVLDQLAQAIDQLAQGTNATKRQVFYALAEKLLATEEHPSDSMLLNTVYYLQYTEELERP